MQALQNSHIAMQLPVAVNATSGPLFSPDWKMATFRIPSPDGSPINEIRSMSVSEEAGLIAVCSREALYLVRSGSIRNGEILHAEPCRRSLFFPGPVVFSPDGNLLACPVARIGAHHNACRIFEVKDSATTLSLHRLAALETSGLPTAMTWSPDGAYLAFGNFDGATTVFDVSKLARGGRVPAVAKFTRRLKPVGLQPTVRSLSFTPGSRALVICYGDGVIRFASLRPEERALLPAGQDEIEGTKAHDELAALNLAAIPGQAAWWKLMQTRRSWVLGRPVPDDFSLRAARHYHGLHGSLSPDGTSIAVSGDMATFSDEWHGRGWLEDRKVEQYSVRLMDLSKIDRRGRPIPREVCRFDLNQEVHSIDFLPDGEHILIATQSCALSMCGCHHTNRLSGDPDLLSQLRILTIDRSGSDARLTSATALGIDCTWAHAAAGRRAKTICAGTYEGDGIVFQRNG